MSKIWEKIENLVVNLEYVLRGLKVSLKERVETNGKDKYLP